MTRSAKAAFNARYYRERDAMLATNPTCWLHLVCDGAPATSGDHDPPLALHVHVQGSGCCRLMPACLPCQREQGRMVAAELRNPTRRLPPEPSRQW